MVHKESGLPNTHLGTTLFKLNGNGFASMIDSSTNFSFYNNRNMSCGSYKLRESLRFRWLKLTTHPEMARQFHIKEHRDSFLLCLRTTRFPSRLPYEADNTSTHLYTHRYKVHHSKTFIHSPHLLQ